MTQLLLDPRRQALQEPSGLPQEGDWYVLQTKSRQEKALCKTLDASRIGAFLPLMRVVRYYGRRKAYIEEPMFPGYLFVRGDLDEVYSADRTGRVAQILRVADQETLDWELSNLHAAMVCQAPVQPFSYLSNGTRVEVRAGPFRGLQGVVERRHHPNQFLLQVDMLGRSMSLEIDGSLLDAID